MFFRYSIEQLIHFTSFSEVCQELFSFLIKTFRLMSSLFWSSNFVSLTQSFHFVKKFFQPLFKHSCVLRWFLSGNSISLARFRHPVKHFFLPISTFFIPLTGLWCPLVERLNRIHLFRHKVNTFFAFICVFCVTILFFLILYTRQALLHTNAKELVYIMIESPVFSAICSLQQIVLQAKQCI